MDTYINSHTTIILGEGLYQTSLVNLIALAACSDEASIITIHQAPRAKIAPGKYHMQSCNVFIPSKYHMKPCHVFIPGK